MISKLSKYILFLLHCSLCLCCTSIEAKETLVFAIDIIRHGDRTPLTALPKKPHFFPEGLGQLTAEGFKQEFELGLKLRERYIQEHQLLPSQYRPSSLYVRSTDYDRTLMSAQAFLLGLYPLGTGPTTLPKNFQPIPIHTNSKDTESLLKNKGDAKAALKALVLKELSQDGEWKKKMSEYQSKFDRWSKYTGFNVKDPYQLVDLADILRVYRLHHIPYPAGLSKRDVRHIIQAGDYTLLRAYHSKVVGKKATNPLIKEITQHLEEQLSTPKELKYVLYSAHDTTLLTLMSALGAPLEEVPRYASHLNIALLKDGNEHRIQVNFNDEIVPIPACSQGTCSLAEWKEITCP